jgi:hypothetical protein
MTLLRRSILRFLPAGKRLISDSAPGRPSRQEFKVVLDNGTLYIDQPLAEALGWKPDVEPAKGVSLTLSGWAPHYFAIAQTGTDCGKFLHNAYPQSSLSLIAHIHRYPRT